MQVIPFITSVFHIADIASNTDRSALPPLLSTKSSRRKKKRSKLFII